MCDFQLVVERVALELQVANLLEEKSQILAALEELEQKKIDEMNQEEDEDEKKTKMAEASFLKLLRSFAAVLSLGIDYESCEYSWLPVHLDPFDHAKVCLAVFLAPTKFWINRVKINLDELHQEDKQEGQQEIKAAEGEKKRTRTKTRGFSTKQLNAFFYRISMPLDYMCEKYGKKKEDLDEILDKLIHLIPYRLVASGNLARARRRIFFVDPGSLLKLIRERVPDLKRFMVLVESSRKDFPQCWRMKRKWSNRWGSTCRGKRQKTLLPREMESEESSKQFGFIKKASAWTHDEMTKELGCALRTPGYFRCIIPWPAPIEFFSNEMIALDPSFFESTFAKFFDFKIDPQMTAPSYWSVLKRVCEKV